MDDALAQAWEEIGQEDFLLLHHLLPKAHEEEILKVYAFARGIDNIADDPMMKPAEKEAQLKQIKTALFDHDSKALPAWARPFELMLRRKHISQMHAEELLAAQLMDVHKRRYQDMDELEAYCQRSAVPLGLMLLEACDERMADFNAATSLCHALQLLNCLQDATRDYLVLERVYIPAQWFKQAGIEVDVLAQTKMSKPLRDVIERMAERIITRLREARPLVASIEDEKLKLLLACIEEAAWATLRKLKRENLLNKRVSLNWFEKLGCIWRAWKKV